MNERNRSITTYTVKENKNGVISTTDGTAFGTTAEASAHLTPGVVFQMEATQGSLVTGIKLDGAEDWLMHESDEDLEAEHIKMIAAFDEDDRQRMVANRDDWTKREAALPEWLKARLNFFRDKSGENFELSGWGYELAVAELAALYAEHGIPNEGNGEHDDPAIEEYAHKYGTTGNQHGCAVWLVKQHNEHPDESLAGTISALSPLTGDAYYEKKRGE